MTDPIQRAAAVRAECVAALEAAKARTQGEWRSNGFWIEQSLDTIAHTGGSRRPNEEQEANAAFIALSSRLTEKSLRATIIALDILVAELPRGFEDDLTAILDAWEKP